VSERRLDIAILAFAVSNAILYSALLPLWEGFDEAFHYGYVQELSRGRGLPVLGKTRLPDEVWRSMHGTPVSHVVARSYSSLITFDRYFEGLRATHIPEPAPANYEAHQAPLAYLAVAPLDAALSARAIEVRVFGVRTFAACAAVVLTFAAGVRIAAAMELEGLFRTAFLFSIFSCQMFYATVAHVANDWLAVPAMAWLIAAMIAVIDHPSRRNGLFLGVIFGAALLVKAYFLALAPLVMAAAIWKRVPLAGLAFAISAPWYARNVVFYSNLTGTQEAYNGIGIWQVTEALANVNWPASIGYMARASLWTANNSFTSFSRTTLNAMLILIALGAILFLVRAKPGKRGLVLLAAVGCYCAMLVYATGAIYYRTSGASAGASPWYSIPLLAPVYAIVFSGFCRAGPGSRWLAALFVAVSGYVLMATYTVKLLPLYSGYTGPGRIADLWRWYSSGRLIALVSIAPPPLVLALSAAVAASTLFLAGAICRRLGRAAA
jgi:hypothetical protein